MVRRAVVHVGGDPHDVLHVPRLQVAKEIRDLELAAERRARIAIGHRFIIRRPVFHDEPERQIRGDDLPRRSTGGEPVLQPRQLCRAKNGGSAIE